MRLSGSVVATTQEMVIKADEMDLQTNGGRQLQARGNVSVQPTPDLLADLEANRRDLERLNSLGPKHPEVLYAKAQVTMVEAKLQRVRDLAAQGNTVRMELGLARPCLADPQDCSELFASPASNRSETRSDRSGK